MPSNSKAAAWGHPHVGFLVKNSWPKRAVLLQVWSTVFLGDSSSEGLAVHWAHCSGHGAHMCKSDQNIGAR